MYQYKDHKCTANMHDVDQLTAQNPCLCHLLMDVSACYTGVPSGSARHVKSLFIWGAAHCLHTSLP